VKLQLFGGLFWGIMLLASGIILLLKYFFNLQASSGKLIFGLFVLLIGVSLLTSNFSWSNFNFNDSNTTSFSSGQSITADDGKDYSVVFGSSDYDLTKMEPGTKVSINCAFGSSTVKLPAGPVQVNANCQFGSIHLPNEEEISFGNRTYSTEGDNPVTVDLHCAFGSVTVIHQ
jgi:hypothetical protein